MTRGPWGEGLRQVADEWARFEAHVERIPFSTCWWWLGSLQTHGYGRFYRRSERAFVQAHRFAYDRMVCPLRDDEILDHLCRNRSCCNPAHLEVVSHRENVLRGIGPTAMQARQTRCKRGHELAGENLVPTGRVERACRACARERNRAYYDRRLRASTC